MPEKDSVPLISTLRKGHYNNPNHQHITELIDALLRDRKIIKNSELMPEIVGFLAGVFDKIHKIKGHFWRELEKFPIETKRIIYLSLLLSETGRKTILEHLPYTNGKEKKFLIQIINPLGFESTGTRSRISRLLGYFHATGDKKLIYQILIFATGLDGEETRDDREFAFSILEETARHNKEILGFCQDFQDELERANRDTKRRCIMMQGDLI